MACLGCGTGAELDTGLCPTCEEFEAANPEPREEGAPVALMPEGPTVRVRMPTDAELLQRHDAECGL